MLQKKILLCLCIPLIIGIMLHIIDVNPLTTEAQIAMASDAVIKATAPPVIQPDQQRQKMSSASPQINDTITDLELPTIKPAWQVVMPELELESMRPEIDTPMFSIALVDPTSFYLAHVGDEMTLALPGAAHLVIKVDEVTYLSEKTRQWSGSTSAADGANPVLMTIHAGVVKGFIGTSLGSYALYLSDGRGWIYQEAPQDFGDDGLDVAEDE